MDEEELCCLSKLVIKLFKQKSSKKYSNIAAPLLPTECMQQIFQHIVDQGVGLYPFLLVNRYWCKNVVPFLWARPFEGLLPENRYKIMLIYLSSLNEREKSELNNSLRPFMISLPDLRPPLFNYPMFLEEFSYKNLEMAVHSCIYRWNSVTRQRDQILVLSTALCKLFLRNSEELKTFIIDKFLSHSDIPDSSIFNTVQPGLKNISNLSIDYTKPMMDNTIRLLELIPFTCTKIRCLDIKIPFFETNPDVIKAIIKIIQAQDCLLEFNLEGVRSGESKDIIQALQTQTGTLTSIKLENIHLSTSSLLSLKTCPNLQSLTILQSIIRSAGDFLIELSFDVITKETVESTTTHCPNITNLHLLNFLPQHNGLLNDLFQGLSKIKKLTLSIYHTHVNRENMIISGRELPVTLEYLKLRCVITRFARSRRTLKYLGIGGRIGWSVREMKELEMLKQKFGVNLIPWDEIDRW
ncbi:3473_t:CDS:2 [Diversispora eburnea]|uniref:3473_t:CDS:1 n=1 Tax=Diversispora eburnea TaxID=1213867 RepID=A0A9N8Z3M2_9GLOM|nr:3473_t:CDS:2 [Diversispora eburnea]